MHPSRFLLATTALLATCVQNVQSAVVFAHYMLGNINADHVAQDIQDAKLAGIDGFSLNIGDPSQPFVLPVVTSLFAAAQAAGTFHLHISMDLYASGDAAGGHPGLYNALLKQFMGHPNYFHVNAAPYVTTFSDGGLENTEWFNWKVSIGTMYFCPNFDNTTGYTTGADGWWDYWGPIVDCVFSWDAAWPVRPGPGNQGSASQGSDEIDVAVMTAATKRGKAYNMPLSTLQYKDSYGTNIYRPGDLTLVKRIENILRLQPQFVTIISWNDGPESHYIGNIWPEQNTDAEPARYVSAGRRWNHSGLRPLIKDFIIAYEVGLPYTGSASMPSLGPASVEGAMWYRTVTAQSTCAPSTRPDNAAAGGEVVNWAIVVGTGFTDVSVRVTSGSSSTTTAISGPGFHYSSVPKNPGQQKIEVLSKGAVIGLGQGGRCVSALCPDGIYNMNDVVVGIGSPIVAPPVIACDDKPIHCQSAYDVAKAGIDNMMDYYVAPPNDAGGGIWVSEPDDADRLWTDSTKWETLYNYVIATGDTHYDIFNEAALPLPDGSKAPPAGWDTFFSKSRDDALWTATAYIKVGEFKQDSNYYKFAGGIHASVAATWSDLCGGGVCWQGGPNCDFKNTVTNGLFLLTSAWLYLKTHDESYYTWATKAWAWIDSAKLRGPDNLYVDGMHTGGCPAGAPGPPDGPLYTYNQGVMIAGLGAYYNATRLKGISADNLIAAAELTLDSIFSHGSFTSGGVLQEHCDGPAVWGTLNNVRNGDCFEGSRRDPNKEVFKGLFMKHMMYYLEWTNDATNVRFGKYRDNFWAQYSAINLKATNKNGEIGSLWWTTDQGGSAYDGYSQESGINAVLAAAAWGGCQI